MVALYLPAIALLCAIGLLPGWWGASAFGGTFWAYLLTHPWSLWTFQGLEALDRGPIGSDSLAPGVIGASACRNAALFYAASSLFGRLTVRGPGRR